MVFLAILAISGSILSKVMFLNVLYREESTHGEYSKFSKNFIFIPLFSAYLLTQKNKLKYKNIAALSEALGIFVFAVFAFTSYEFFENYAELKMIDVIAFFIIHFIILSGMLYLSIYDIATLTIQERDVKLLFLIAVLANFFVAIVRFIYFRIEGIVLFKYLDIGNLDNLLAGGVIAFLIWLIIKITKNEGMGEGDIDTMAIVGLILGWPHIFSSFFFSIIIGSLIGILYSLKLGKLKGVVIPFVPLILIGYIIALGYGEAFFDLITHRNLVY